MSDNNICLVCKKVAEHKCSACKLAFYCSRQHQKLHWKEHAKNCQVFKLTEDNIVGRHYVAARKIEIGEVILRERKPLVIGPPVDTCPVCLECYTVLTRDNAKACDKCGWPLCKDCQQHGDECQFTAQHRQQKVSVTEFGHPHPTYKCITIIRVLALRQVDPEAYEKFINLQGYPIAEGDQPSEIDRLCARSRDIANFIKRFFNVDFITEDEIVKVAGIIQINGHEVPLTEPPYIAVYDKASYFEHNCQANSSKSFTENGGVIIRAAVTINKGDHITMCYTDPLWGTVNRRHHLKETKYFNCMCRRCSDPTEFKTMFNGLKCTEGCCPGTILPPTFLIDSDSDIYPDYVCNKCDSSMKWHQVEKKLEEIGMELSSMKKNDVNEAMKFVEKYTRVLHENHFYMIDVKLALAQMIGQQDGGLPAVSDELLNEKISLCKKLDEFFRLIVPAENRLRGLILYEVHAAIAEFGRRQGKEQLLEMLTLSRKALMESYQLLQYESEVFPEGKIARMAQKNITEMENILKLLTPSIAPL